MCTSLQAVTGGEIKDCIIANNTTYGVRLYNNAAVTVSYTDCWGNGTNYSGNVITYGAGCISANPLWVNPDAGDFHLQGGSPCDNTGSDGGDMGYRYGVEPPSATGAGRQSKSCEWRDECRDRYRFELDGRHWRNIS